MPLISERCRECDGEEVVFLGRKVGVPTIRPCSRCRPLQFMLWSGGHYLPNHTCGPCVDLRKGSAQVRGEARANILSGWEPVDLNPAMF